MESNVANGTLARRVVDAVRAGLGEQAEEYYISVYNNDADGTFFVVAKKDDLSKIYSCRIINGRPYATHMRDTLDVPRA